MYNRLNFLAICHDLSLPRWRTVSHFASYVARRKLQPGHSPVYKQPRLSRRVEGSLEGQAMVCYSNVDGLVGDGVG